ncbi:thrombomodulin [Engraulis encrasicolus]|uniref:thrombomodulin n=1 Tax=Engraulis encrasicolus TaxID=184585 RepID=UPI002FD63EEA
MAFTLSLSARVSIFLALFSCGNTVTRNCVCKNDVCKAAFTLSSNFHTAKELCEDMGGQLMAVPSQLTNDELKDLLSKTNGEFWIGLRLPHGQCTDVTLPLKGYRWTSDPSVTQYAKWRGHEKVCSSHCVSVSVDLKWTEQLCKLKRAGFLCEKIRIDVCSSFVLEKKESIVFNDLHPRYSTAPCAAGMCEHRCQAKGAGSYTCSCYDGFAVSKKEQHHCVPNNCLDDRCEPSCVGDAESSSCTCQGGYLLHEEHAAKICEDINECEQNSCDDFCYNSLGSYECSCQNGYRLEANGKCVKMKIESNEIDGIGWATRRPDLQLTPSLNYTRHASVGSPGKSIGIIVVVAVGIIGVIFFVRYWKQKIDEPSTSLTSNADDVQVHV